MEKTIGRLTFTQVDYDELIKGRKYRIEEISTYHIKVYKGIYDGPYQEVLYMSKWNNLSYSVTDHWREHTGTNEFIIFNQLIKKRNFFKLSSNRSIMERRVLNTILKKIMNEPCINEMNYL